MIISDQPSKMAVSMLLIISWCLVLPLELLKDWADKQYSYAKSWELLVKLFVFAAILFVIKQQQKRSVFCMKDTVILLGRPICSVWKCSSEPEERSIS